MHSVPKILHPDIEASRYYAKNSKSLVIQGDGSRDRTDNVQECHKKLHAMIIAAGRSSVRGETSPAQVEKVKNLYVFATCDLLSNKFGSLCGYAGSAERITCACWLRRRTETRKPLVKGFGRSQIIERLIPMDLIGCV